MPRPSHDLPPVPHDPDPSRMVIAHGWPFHEGDIVAAKPEGHNANHLSVKVGNAAGAAAMSFDGSDWRAVRLPHDRASEQPFFETANISQGYRPRGIGWYRRILRLDPADRGRTILLQFDKIVTNATIRVNDSVVAHKWSAHTSIDINLTPFARFGDDHNVIAVRVDADAMGGW